MLWKHAEVGSGRRGSAPPGLTAWLAIGAAEAWWVGAQRERAGLHRRHSRRCRPDAAQPARKIVALPITWECPAGLTALLEVEAWVVDVRDAAGADDAGILNPLLHRFQVLPPRLNTALRPDVPPCVSAFLLVSRTRADSYANAALIC